MSMSLTPFNSLETNEKQNININLIEGIFVPLKDEEIVKSGNAKIGNIENEKGGELKDILEKNQYTNELNVKHLVFDDTPITRIFIGGISIFGLYILFNLLYKKTQ